MQIGTHLAALFFFLASGCTAYLCCKRLPLPRGKAVRVLCGLVLWELLQLLPVHILATLQLFGLPIKVAVPTLAIIQAALLAGAVTWTVTQRQPTYVEVSNLERWPHYVLVTGALLAGSYCLFALNLFTSYLGGSDALAYHLPLALHWLQTGSFAIPVSKAWRFGMPGNAEVGMMLLLASGSESAVVLVNWIALAVLAIATYLLAQWVGRRDHLTSTIVVLVLLSIPVIEFQTFSAYVDLFGTSFLVAAFSLLLYREESETGKPPQDEPGVKRPAVLFLSAAACGISLGTKPVYDLYAAAFGAVAVFLLLKHFRRSQRPIRTLAAGVALLGAGLLLPSAFWFTRASVETHNPLFPMRVAVGGHEIFSGYAASEITNPDFDLNFVRRRSQWPVYPWTEWRRNPGSDLTVYGEGSGLGAAFTSLIVIGVAYLVYRLIRGIRGGMELPLLLALIGFSLAWWFALHKVLRFGLPMAVLMCVMAVPLIRDLRIYRERAFRLLLLSSVLVTCVISTFVPFHQLLGRIRTRHWTRAAFYNYPPILDKLPAGTCVLNETGNNERNFSLAGARLRNCVVPAFEAPKSLDAQFVRENNISYVAEIVPANGEGFVFPQFELLRDQVINADEYTVRWRIWQVKHPQVF
jgi:hypothetical protein